MAAVSSPLPAHSPLFAGSDFLSMLDNQITAPFVAAARQCQELLIDTKEQLQQLNLVAPCAVPICEIQSIDELFSRFDDLLHTAECDTARLPGEYFALVETLRIVAHNALRRVRIGCYWYRSASQPSLATTHSGSDPQFLLRGQMADATAWCQFSPTLGITSAKKDATCEAELDRQSKAYRETLRFHCNGYHKSRGPTYWISTSDSPLWMLDQIHKDSYGWSSPGHRIAFIDVARLELLSIPFGPSDQLVVEGRLHVAERQHYRMKFPPWDVVKWATPHHYLVFDWIPAECITWVDIDDFVQACNKVLLGRSSSDDVPPEDVFEAIMQTRSLRDEKAPVSVLIEALDAVSLNDDADDKDVPLARTDPPDSVSLVPPIQTQAPPHEPIRPTLYADAATQTYDDLPNPDEVTVPKQTVPRAQGQGRILVRLPPSGPSLGEATSGASPGAESSYEESSEQLSRPEDFVCQLGHGGGCQRDDAGKAVKLSQDFISLGDIEKELDRMSAAGGGHG